MHPKHHVDDATLISYCAGALPQALSIVVTTHIAICPECRRKLALAESIGGALIQTAAREAGFDAKSRSTMRRMAENARSDSGIAPRTTAPSHDLQIASHTTDMLPATLQPFFGQRYSQLPWRMLAPGVRHVRAHDVSTGTLTIYKVGAGIGFPSHGHGKNELTMILHGTYRDELGQYDVGDIADLDESVVHQPIAMHDGCMALAATDAPLRFESRLLRLIAPLLTR